MKKLVLLQLLLLPLGGLLDSASSAEAASAGKQPSAAVERVESELSNFAKRLVGLSYAQSPRGMDFLAR